MTQASRSNSRRSAETPLTLSQLKSLRYTCFEAPLTPEGDDPPFDCFPESGSSCLSADQFPVADCLSRPKCRLQPPSLTREETYDSFDEPRTPLGFDMESMTGSGTSGSVSSAGQDSATSKGKPDTYIKPHGSVFDASHACGWFPDAPSVPQSEMVVSDFADLGKITQFPPSAWKLGPDRRLVRNHEVKFESPSLPIAGPVPVSDIVEREMRALMRQREEVTRILELEEGDLAMRGIDVDVLVGHSDKPKLLWGPEGTEIYDGVNEYPEEWSSHQSTRLCYHPTEELDF